MDESLLKRVSDHNELIYNKFETFSEEFQILYKNVKDHVENLREELEEKQKICREYEETFVPKNTSLYVKITNELHQLKLENKLLSKSSHTKQIEEQKKNIENYKQIILKLEETILELVEQNCMLYEELLTNKINSEMIRKPIETKLKFQSEECDNVNQNDFRKEMDLNYTEVDKFCEMKESDITAIESSENYKIISIRQKKYYLKENIVYEILADHSVGKSVYRKNDKNYTKIR